MNNVATLLLHTSQSKYPRSFKVQHVKPQRYPKQNKFKGICSIDVSEFTSVFLCISLQKQISREHTSP